MPLHEPAQRPGKPLSASPAPRPDPVDAIGWLRRAARKLAASGDPDLVRLAAAIGRYDAGRGATTLDAECGLTSGGGAGPWWRVEVRARRDSLLREVRSSCLAELDLTAAAAAIITQARQRQATTAPAATRQARLVDQALQCGPLPEKKQLRAILGNSPP